MAETQFDNEDSYSGSEVFGAMVFDSEGYVFDSRGVQSLDTCAAPFFRLNPFHSLDKLTYVRIRTLNIFCS